MNTVLDPSHVALVKGWRTFKTMKKSADEVQNYLLEVAGSAVAELKKRYAPDLKSDSGELTKRHFFDIYPAEFEGFGGMAIRLMRFGVERIEIENLTDPNAESPCRACAYTPDENPGIWMQLCPFLAELPDPEGFSKFHVEEDGYRYIYIAELPRLNPEDFANIVQLREAFCDPMSKMWEWYKKHAEAIRGFQPQRFRRTSDLGTQI